MKDVLTKPGMLADNNTRLFTRAVGYFFLAPCAILMVIFTVYPALASLYNSFFLISPFGDKRIFVTWENYLELLSSPSYHNSLKVTLMFVVLTVPVGIVFAIVVAVLLNQDLFGMTVYRTIFFLPLAISPAMAGVIWKFFYNTRTGLLNYLLELANINGPAWLTDPKWALIAIALTTVWKQSGFNIIILLAGLQNIPEELYEAAKIDGAQGLKIFRYITLPLLSPALFFVLITSVINSFEVFGQVHVLTHGGPAQATNLLVYDLYRTAFVNFNTGLASAQATAIFFIVLAITLFQWKVVGKKVHYQ